MKSDFIINMPNETGRGRAFGQPRYDRYYKSTTNFAATESWCEKGARGIPVLKNIILMCTMSHEGKIPSVM